LPGQLLLRGWQRREPRNGSGVSVRRVPVLEPRLPNSRSVCPDGDAGSLDRPAPKLKRRLRSRRFSPDEDCLVETSRVISPLSGIRPMCSYIRDDSIQDTGVITLWTVYSRVDRPDRHLVRRIQYKVLRKPSCGGGDPLFAHLTKLKQFRSLYKKWLRVVPLVSATEST